MSNSSHFQDRFESEYSSIVSDLPKYNVDFFDSGVNHDSYPYFTIIFAASIELVREILSRVNPDFDTGDFNRLVDIVKQPKNRYKNNISIEHLCDR